VPTVVRKGRMSIPNEPGTPKSSPRLEAEDRSSKENTSLPAKETAIGRKTLPVWQAWRAVRRTRTEGSILLGPQEPMIQMKIGGHPIDLMVDTGA
jgi:hypothetical protein